MANESFTVNELSTGNTTVTVADDGSGFDKIVVTGSYIEQVEINLGWTTTNGLPTSAEGLYFNETGGHRLIVTGIIEEAVGSDSRDFIQGNELDNTISGEAVYFGVGANDVLWGLGGNDAIHGCTGDDSIQGDEGDDLLYGDSGSDLISGDSGVDTIEGGAGADNLSGGADHGDRLSYENSTAAVLVALVFGADGSAQGGDAEGDTIRGFTELQGSALADSLADADKGTIAFGQNDNVFLGDGGNDTVLAGGGNDLAYGGTDADSLDGEAGDDSLFGDSGQDRLLGGVGNDSLNGGMGGDTMTGGVGDDTFVANANTDVVIEGVDGGHDLVMSAVNWTLGAQLEDLTLLGEATQGSGNFRANVITGNDIANVLNGYGGDDSLLGGLGNDKLLGGAGNDVLDGQAGGDTMTGGLGDDTYYADVAFDVVIEAIGEGRDLMVSSVNWSLQAGLDDLILAGAALRGTGNNFANRLSGNALDNVLNGFAGADTVIGGAGNDSVLGGGGDDILYGGRGSDSVTGAQGADQFIFATLTEIASQAAGYDRISDFSHADLDKIDLSALDAKVGVAGNQTFRFIDDADFSGVKGQLHYVTTVGGLLVLGDTDGDATADFTILVEGVRSLVAGDFIL